MAEKTTKSGALYLYREGSKYQCRECSLWLPSRNQCEIHGANDVIRGHGTCGLFIKGEPAGASPTGQVSKAESGYEENKEGFSCDLCEYWIPLADCKLVDRNSPGDTPGEVIGSACCNLWEKHDS